MTTASRFGRVALLSITALLLLTLAPGVASAGTSSTTTSTGRSADVYWTQVDATAGQFGNWHEGYLSARQAGSGKANVDVWITDFLCDEGETPWGDHHGEAACDHVGERYGTARKMPFTMAANLSRATLKGSINLQGGHGGSTVGSPMIDIVLTGVGPQTHYTNSYSYRRGQERVEYSETGRDRQATVSGTIGPMGFDPSTSGASMRKWSWTETATYQ